MPKTERMTFTGAGGEDLAGRLDLPDGPPRAVALFAHCFTCGKDVVAASRISRALTEAGLAVFRFDFTGLGESDGEFANATFSSNVTDLIRAADHLRSELAAPSLLIGHSLGGAAVLAAAAKIPEAVAVVTIAAPSDPAHVVNLFADDVDEIEDAGIATVRLAGRTFRVRREFLADIAAQPQAERIAELGRALLVLHAPGDQLVGIDNAREIFDAARHPKSFVSLDDADHLVSDPADAAYAATVIAGWADRYLPSAPPVDDTDTADGIVIVSETGDSRYTQRIRAGRHLLIADEPTSLGGGDHGPTPYDLLLAALGTCTSMTMRMYAERKGWPLRSVSVRLRHSRIHAEDCAHCETTAGKLDHIQREIHIEGDLDAEQRARLLTIADRCPVHRTLHSEIVVDTTEGTD
ncbi:bifunctional alpha/beta hydrolase/OsmC family protein [Phytoactinopolyspora limicola]|uniref:bifunctional alpha/beta hydrolase/OsmC family protein n=1 Tax=Phytoactinopolyspora limicola TaxID=2715536 RepID=UPI00140AB638|nr:bifunctional alpha/beta hydrolase/OsmC family protein [Phytoactinopolyspora limicola]